MGSNGDTDGAVLPQKEPEKNTKLEVLSEDIRTAGLDGARGAEGQSRGKETLESGCAYGPIASDGVNSEFFYEGGERHSDALEDGSNGDEARQPVLEFASVDVVLEGSIPSRFIANVGEGSQQHKLEIEKVDNVEVENDKTNGALELLYNGSEVLFLGGNDEKGLEKDGNEAIDALDSMELQGYVSKSLILDGDERHSFPKLEPSDNVENAVKCKEAEPKQLSKSALKQLAKQARYKEIKLQRKAVEKEKRHQETARKRRQWEEKLATLTKDEREKTMFEKMSIRKERKEEQQARKEKLRQALETGQDLVIDLEFCELMKPNEITSLIQQVMYSYAANGRAAVPGRISLTGVRGDIKKELEKISGFNNWLVHKEELSYVEVFEKRISDLVYLTADSENTLESLDTSKIYIVGGLVDRNRWKNITLEKATKQGIATAKLPVGHHLKMMSSQVLTVNQVMELLLCFLELGDWKKSLMQVVPLRKRAAEESL